VLVVEKDFLCLRCGEALVYESKGFWKCPRCGGEWWDDENKLADLSREDKEKALAANLRMQVLWSIGKRFTPVLPAGRPDLSKGSSRSAKRKRKKPKIVLPQAQWQI